MNYYRIILNRLLQGMAEKRPTDLLVQEIRNNQQLQTKYQELGSLQRFIDWLIVKADEADADYSGAVLFSEVAGRG